MSHSKSRGEIIVFTIPSDHWNDAITADSSTEMLELSVQSSESAVVKQLQRKPRNYSEAPNGIRTHDLRDTGAMLYQLSYEVSLEAGQFYPLYEESGMMCI